MKYWMTIECGGWWGEIPDITTGAWGVSESQQRLAKHVLSGDVLIHYIISVRAWVGYSTVIRPMEKNTRDADEDWAAAHPSMIPIKAEVWLDMNQSAATTKITDLQDKAFHRQNAFTEILPENADLIVAAIGGQRSHPPC